MPYVCVSTLQVCGDKYCLVKQGGGDQGLFYQD